MKLSKADGYFILLVLLIIALIGLNELGYGILSLFLLFPAYFLMVKAFETVRPK